MAINAESIQYGPWTGGVRYDRAVEDVGQDELSAMENCRIGTSGQVEKRQGTDSYEDATAIAGTPTVTMVAEFDVNATTTHTVIVAGTKIYYYNSGWTDITGAVSITAGDDNTFEWVNANGTLIATNGVDAPWKWTGTGNAAALDVDSRFTTAKHIAYWQNRVWMGNTNANTDRLWYSDIGDPGTWGATSFYNIGYPITAIVPMQNNLAPHTEDGIWTLIPTGNATIPYQLQQRTQQGSVGGRCALTVPGQIQYFIRPDGVYQWTGADIIEKVSYALDEGYWPNLPVARLDNAFAIYYRKENEVWFFWAYGTAQTKANHVMIYNTRFQCWYGPYTGWERDSAAIVDNKPHAGGFDGLLYDCITGDNDDGAAISATFTTGAPAPQGGSVRERWLYAKHYFDAEGNYRVGVAQESAGLIGATADIQTDGGNFTLGTSVLDTDNLQELRMVSQDTDLSGYDPHSSLRYYNNNADEPFTFRRVLLQFKTIGRKRKRNFGST